MVLHITETQFFRSDRTNREHSRHSHIMSHSIKKESTVRCFAQELFPQASCLSKGSTSAPSVRALKVAKLHHTLQIFAGTSRLSWLQ